MRRRIPWWLMVLLFVVVPVAEIALLIQVGQVIGAGWTVLLLLASGVLGGYLVKREGARAWRAFVEALRTGRMPARELADGALILVGGTLLLTPGFLTDAAGLVAILPVSRPLVRGALTSYIARRFVLVGGPAGYGPTGSGPPGSGPTGSGGHDSGPGVSGDRQGARARQRPGTDESVVRGEVID